MPRFKAKLLLDHLPGCTPRAPCTSCKAMSYLRGFLTEEQMNGFLEIIESAPHKQVQESKKVVKVITGSIDELELRSRTSNCLKAVKIHTVPELLRCSESRLARLKGFGRQMLVEVREVLAARGLPALKR